MTDPLDAVKSWLCERGWHPWENIWSYDKPKMVCKWCGYEAAHIAEYSQQDHIHCWESKTPPCGQKVGHLKCCLCELRNPN